jgi:Fe-S cluster biogenesis protein NfuA
MPDVADDRQLKERIRALDALLVEVDSFKDPQARSRTQRIVQCLMDLHGAALERMLECIADSPQSGVPLIHKLAEDESVANLLLIYGLHPLDMNSRVRLALDKVRPYLQSHGGNVELLGLEQGVVRLRLQGSCHGCPSSAQTLKQSIEEAIMDRAPDVSGIEVVGEGGEVLDIVDDQGMASGDASASGHRVALPVLAG